MTSVDYSFTIYTGNRCLVVAASSQEEKGKWMEDIWKAISASATREDEPIKSIYSSLKSNSEFIAFKRKFGWIISWACCFWLLKELCAQNLPFRRFLCIWSAYLREESLWGMINFCCLVCRVISDSSHLDVVLVQSPLVFIDLASELTSAHSKWVMVIIVAFLCLSMPRFIWGSGRCTRWSEERVLLSRSPYAAEGQHNDPRLLAPQCQCWHTGSHRRHSGVNSAH